MKRSGGFTLVEAVVLLFAIGVLVALVLVMIPGPRPRARQSESSLQLRGIHKGLVLYSMDNNGYFPGLAADGSDVDISVEGRFLALLDGDYFSGQDAISPLEAKQKAAWKPGMTTLTTANYSYILLQLPAQGERRTEWRDTVNSRAPVASDRVIIDDHGRTQSLHTSLVRDWTGWKGYVVWNDNHVTFERPIIVHTEYGTSQHDADDLFKAEGDDDAYMIYEGK